MSTFFIIYYAGSSESSFSSVISAAFSRRFSVGPVVFGFQKDTCQDACPFFSVLFELILVLHSFQQFNG